MKLSKKLVELRMKNGLVVNQVSQRSGIDVERLTKYENGTLYPNEEELKKLKEIYNYLGDFPLCEVEVDNTNKSIKKDFTKSLITFSIIFVLFVLIYAYLFIYGFKKNIEFIVIFSSTMVIIESIIILNSMYKFIELHKKFKNSNKKLISFYLDQVTIEDTKTGISNTYSYSDFDNKIIYKASSNVILYYNNYQDVLFINFNNVRNKDKIINIIKNIKRKEENLKFAKFKGLTKTTFILSWFLIPFMFIFLVVYAARTCYPYFTHDYLKYGYISLILMLIPLISILFSYIGKNPKRRTLRVILMSMITLILFLFGYASIEDRKNISYDYNKILDISKDLNVDFVDDGTIKYYKYYSDNDSYQAYVEFKTHVLHSEFIDDVYDKSIWKKEINLNLNSDIKSILDLVDFDYYITYDVTNTTYTPSVNGQYDLIFVAYRLNSNSMEVFKYKYNN